MADTASVVPLDFFQQGLTWFNNVSFIFQRVRMFVWFSRVIGELWFVAIYDPTGSFQLIRHYRS